MMRFLAILAVFAASAASARAEIAISPLRQVLTGAEQAATFRISNPSDRIMEMRVDWVDLAATESGYALAPPGLRATLSAAPYLTVKPARLRLDPGASTEVTVAIREGVALPAGERRSHLLIRSDAVRTPLRKTSGGLELDIGLGISVPVILRSGPGATGARIGDTRLSRNAGGDLDLETSVEPRGSFSAYGRLAVYFAESGREPELIRVVDNISAHVDARRRRITIPLGQPRLPPGSLEVRYEGRAEYEGQLFARRIFAVAPPQECSAPATPSSSDSHRPFTPMGSTANSTTHQTMR
jgi:hypothetical protein